MIGAKFGLLTVTGNDQHKQTGEPTVRWHCVCTCGRKRTIQLKQLQRKAYTSCGQKGCKSTMVPKHGRSGTREYVAWNSMKMRCLNPNNNKFYMYGGAGITVCNRWLKFERFFADMGLKPSSRHSLGRIDGTKGYNKRNCRWELPYEQSSNISHNRNLTYRDQTLCVSAWARQLGIQKETINGRLRNGWSVEDALGSKTYSRASDGRKIAPPRMLTFKGNTMSMSDWARYLKIPAWRIWQRRRQGLPIEKILAEHTL